MSIHHEIPSFHSLCEIIVVKMMYFVLVILLPAVHLLSHDLARCAHATWTMSLMSSLLKPLHLSFPSTLTKGNDCHSSLSIYFPGIGNYFTDAANREVGTANLVVRNSFLAYWLDLCTDHLLRASTLLTQYILVWHTQRNFCFSDIPSCCSSSFSNPSNRSIRRNAIIVWYLHCFPWFVVSAILLWHAWCQK